MNDPEHFLSRWSRRKREAADESNSSPDNERRQDAADAPHGGPADGPVPDATTPEQRAAKSEAAEPVFDLSSLPSIESITAETDIRAFLAPGVPAELRVAALRRAWVVDPKVRDFVGLADYDWDFHTPGALEGFGPLSMTDELRREVLRIVGELPTASEPATPPAPTTPVPTNKEWRGPPSAASSEPSATKTLPKTAPGPDQISASRNSSEQDQDELISSTPTSQRNKALGATREEQSSPDDLRMPARRSHGRALPE